MNIKNHLFFLCGLCLLVGGCARNTGGTNQRQEMPPAEPVLEVTPVFRAVGDSLHVYLQLEDSRQVAGFFSTDSRLSYTITSVGEEPRVLATDTLNDFTQRLQTSEEKALFSFPIPLNQISLPATLQIMVGVGRGMEERRKKEFLLGPDLNQKDFLLRSLATGLPLFRNYLQPGENFIIEHADSLQVFSLKKYEASFDAALPPMSSRATQSSRTLTLQHTYQSYANDTVFLPERGLYLIQPDSNNRVGEGMLVEGGAFPGLSTAEELIRPLIYITSTQERDQLTKASDPKVAVDQFWLEVAGDKTIARSLIRLYYGRVTEANQRYSSHKAGWLTDRGMIYIVFGPPQVRRTFADREEWYYERNNPTGAVRFVFLKKPNVFTQNHYELVRSKALESHWYSTVEQWRRGLINP